MSENPEVSVIIPTYNRGNLLEKAVNSVLHQTFGNFEIIIIDDGSTDDTEKIIRAYNDERIRYYYTAHTGYISSVRNEGIKRSKGKYIAFLDSDDQWHRQKLARQVEVLEKSENSFSLTDYHLVESKNEELHASLISEAFEETKPVTPDTFSLIINNEWSFYPSTLIFPREFLDTTGMFDESIPVSEVEFVGRLSHHFTAIFLPEKTAVILKHGQNTSESNLEKCFDEKYLLMDKLLRDDIITKRQYNRSLVAHHLSYLRLPGLSWKYFFAKAVDTIRRSHRMEDWFSLLKIFLKKILVR